MPAYTATTWTNGVTAVNQTNMNKIETQLAAAPYSMFFLATPYLFINNVTINLGVTNNYTCTGGATGVTSGAKAVLIMAYFTGSALGTYLQFKPHSATVSSPSNYPFVGTAQTTSQILGGSIMVPVDGSGIIDVTAVIGNCTGISASIYGYVY